MSENKELNIEQLEKVNGGEITPEMLTVVSNMKNEANIEYQNWLLANLGASEQEKEVKYSECLSKAYNNLSATDKALVDSYYQQLNINAIYPKVFDR